MFRPVQKVKEGRKIGLKKVILSKRKEHTFETKQKQIMKKKQKRKNTLKIKTAILLNKEKIKTEKNNITEQNTK